MLARQACSRFLWNSSFGTVKTNQIVPLSRLYANDAAVAETPEPAPSQPTPSSSASPSFYSLLRNSNFVKLGSLRRSPKPVIGKIVHIVDDDLYIEFGGKFKAVCQRPRSQGRKYQKGVDVTLVLHDLEMTSRFLGAVRDTTLLEADATLLGLAPKLDDVTGEDALTPTEEEEKVINLSDTLSFDDFDNLFVDPSKLEGGLREEYVQTETTDEKTT